MKTPRQAHTTRGFSRAATLLQKPIRKASESRGFAQSRVLTHWAEIVGADVAKVAHPVDISYARGGFGATLTLLTTGAQAPMLEMQKESIREKVNACYGYNAIARIRLTQTAPTGFAEGQRAFEGKPKATKSPRPQDAEAGNKLAQAVEDDDLRAALSRLGANVLSKNASKS
ncbi:MAG: DciA family protein [Pseudomonadota bacterium]